MRKIILMAVAGYFWKKYKTSKTTTAPLRQPPAAGYNAASARP